MHCNILNLLTLKFPLALLYEAQVVGSDWCYPDVSTHLRVSTGVIPVKEAVVLASQSKFPKEKHFSRNDATTQR